MNKILLAVAAIALSAFYSSSVFAVDDKKGISGYGCFPQSGKFQADFFFGGGAIINNASVTRNVVCTIFRDKYSANDGSPEVDKVLVYFTRDAAAGSTSLACQVLVRDLTTGNITDSEVGANGTTVGNGFLTIERLDYASELDAIYMFCRLPAKSRILGLRWEEDLDNIDGNGVPTNGTELGEGE